jgi:hypothetical protein
MTWTKLGDEFADECWTLSDRAFRLHAEGLLWSNRMLTDGQLAKEDMRRWAHHPEAAEELVDVGWWQDRGAHYAIIHHIGYQRTKAQIAKQSIANRANRAKGKQRPVRHKPESSNGSSDESSDEMDRTGQVQDRPGKEPNNVSANGEKTDEYGAVIDDAYDRELADYFAAGAAYEPPTTDCDGNPLEDVR